MKEQRVVRTYPRGYGDTGSLEKALKEGFYVVMAKKFDIGNDDKKSHGKLHGIEYIVEREHK
jgi:hypothetical protein